MEKPKSIFKYESFSEKSLGNLKARSIYFGSPLKFNDPYDCALTVKILEPNDSEFEIIKKKYIVEANLDQDAIFFIESSKNEILRPKFMGMAQSVIETVRDRFLKQCGVTCFSETNSDLLMWSHYGDKYKGFCLEFSTKHEPFKNIHKVDYACEIPQITLESILFNAKNQHDFILNLLTTKSKSWMYEKEWRAIHQNVGTQSTYEKSALKSVYFGPEMDFKAGECIAQILASHNSEVELWRGRRSTEKYEVLFDRINYKIVADK